MTILARIVDLKFPYADSARYLQTQDRSLFQRFFFIPDQFDKLVSSPCYFIIGDKGTGKTAFATYISNGFHPSMDGLTISIEKSDFDNFLTLSNSLPVPLSLADYIGIWETLNVVLSFTTIYRLISSGSLDHAASSTSLFSAIDELSFGSPFTRFADVFDLVLWNRTALYSKVQAVFPNRIVGPIPERLSTYLRILKSAFIDSLKGLKNPEKTYAVFIDGIDTRPVSNMSPSNGPSENNHIMCISALVDAVWNLNTKILSPVFGTNYRLILLVRPDILERINIQNTSLLVRDNAVFLNWYARNNAYRQSTIFSLADNILLQQQSDPTIFSRGECWDNYFPDKMQTYGSRERDSFVALLHNSFYRPRDVITIYQTLREYMISTGCGDQRKFDINMLKQWGVKQRYSEYLLGEVKESTLFYYDLKEYDLFLKFFEFLADRLNGLEFTYSDFTNAYEELHNYFRINNIAPAAIYETADNFLQFLYELNIVGFWAQGGERRILYFCVANRSYVNIRPKIKSGADYRLHYGIARALYPARIS